MDTFIIRFRKALPINNMTRGIHDYTLAQAYIMPHSVNV
jgi:hypothetical protein